MCSGTVFIFKAGNHTLNNFTFQSATTAIIVQDGASVHITNSNFSNVQYTIQAKNFSSLSISDSVLIAGIFTTTYAISVTTNSSLRVNNTSIYGYQHDNAAPAIGCSASTMDLVNTNIRHNYYTHASNPGAAVIATAGCDARCTGCNFTSNMGFGGGCALYLFNSKFHIADSFFSKHTKGTVLVVNSPISIFNSTFTENQGTKNPTAYSAALLVRSSPSVSIMSSYFIANTMGRAVEVSQTNLTVSDTLFDGNDGDATDSLDKPALACGSSTCFITNSRFINNIRGCIHISNSNLTLTHCNVSSNQGGVGAGLRMRCTKGIVDQMQFNSNTLNQGSLGGIIAADSVSCAQETNVYLSNIDVSNNVLSNAFGAISIDSWHLHQTVVLDNITCVNNQAGGSASETGGGCIFQYKGDLQVLNSKITDNKVINGGDGGAGIYSTQGTLLVRNTTISRNTATGPAAFFGGGIFASAGARRILNYIFIILLFCY